MPLISVTAFLDWKAQIHNAGASAIKDPITQSKITLLQCERAITKTLIAVRGSSRDRFRVTLRLYHGWHRGQTPTEHRIAMLQLQNDPYFSLSGTSTAVLFEQQLHFGERLLDALPHRLTPQSRKGMPMIHLPDSYRAPLNKGGLWREKMVDTGLACDVLTHARSDGRDWRIILAEDDDLVPALFVAESWSEGTRRSYDPSAKTRGGTTSPVRGLDKGVRPMIPSALQIKKDLAVFSDLGTEPPDVLDTETEISARLIRGGDTIFLRIQKSTGRVTAHSTELSETRHINYRALLASDHFANLRAWASAQYQLLRESIDEKAMLPIRGHLSAQAEKRDASIEQVEAFLTSTGEEASVRVLLIDGPAGIGKTRFVEQVALRRARNFIETQNPLVLHVKSRGRVLTYLQDLMAFSLQVMRLQVTFDQVPILVRHGLIQLAIDGFDELGDPNGYETAWSQVRELVEDIEGHGTLILAGRETFIGRERLLNAIPRLDEPRHEVGVFSILPVLPNTARSWLRGRITEEKIEAAEAWGLFEQDSYALRPFFLTQLAELLSGDADLERAPPLVSLATSMIEREADKFPENVSAIWDAPQRTQFVAEVLEEIARDMAENQTDSIEEEALIWIVDAALGDEFDPDLSRILKHRVQALAFLQNDERKGRRRFAHSEFLNYFLCQAAITAISRGEVPKFVRRTLFGPDILVTFSLVVTSLNVDAARRFVQAAIEMLRAAPSLDRADRNLGALLLASLPIAEVARMERLEGLGVDDAVVRGVAGKVDFADSTINQMDLRECDLSAVSFRNVAVAAVVGDSTTRVPRSFPDPGWIQYVHEGREESLSGPDASIWINEHGRGPDSGHQSATVPDRVRTHDLFQLLQRVCRVMLRQHWIRSDGDDPITRLVQHEYWPELRELLEQQELLDQRSRKQASGPPSTFFHVKHAREILSEERDNRQVASFLKRLSERVLELSE